MATQEDLTAEGLEVPPKSDEPAKKQHVASREFEEVPQIVEHCSKSVNFTPFGTHARYSTRFSFLALVTLMATCFDARYALGSLLGQICFAWYQPEGNGCV